MKKKSRFARYSLQDKALLLTGYILLGLFVIAIVVPMCYIVVASFMDPITLQNKGIACEASKRVPGIAFRVQAILPSG